MRTDKNTARDMLSILSDGLEETGVRFLVTAFTPGMEARPVKTFEWTENIYLKEDLQYYFTPNPRGKLPVNANGKVTQGGKKDVAYANCLFVDIDYGSEGHKKGSFYSSEEEVLSAMVSFELKPSIVYHSGHGIQAIYLFEQALSIGKDISIAEYETLNRQLQQALKADTTPSIGHLLRLPGSLNLKTAPKPVEIIEVTEFFYPLETFRRVLAKNQKTPLNPATGGEQTSRLKKVKCDKRKLNDRIKYLVKDLTDLYDTENTDRSNLVFKAILEMTKQKLTDSEIYSVVTLSGSSMYEYLLMKRGDEEEIKKEVVRCIRKSRELLKKRINERMSQAEIIGLNPKHEVLYRKNGNIMSLSINKLNADTLQVITGKRPKLWEVEAIKEKILDQCNKNGLVYEDAILKEGIWKKKDEFLIISKDSALKLSETTFKEYKEPIYDGKLIDLKGSSEWVDRKHLVEIFEAVKLSDVFTKFHRIADQFNWKHLESSEYITALIMLAPFQQAVSWNCFVYLVGASGTGKSTFLQDFFSNLYPGLLNHLGKSTAHAIAQEIGNTGRIPVLDEFEKNRHIPQILELAKIANRGGYKTSGTPGSSSLRYSLKHMFFFASIYLSLHDEAQLNRALVLELDRIKKTGPFSLPNPRELKKLGTESIAAVLKYWDAIEKRSESVKNRYPELDARMKDTLKYPISILEIVEEELTGQAVVKAPPVFAYVTPEREEEGILDDLLSSDLWIQSDTPAKMTVFRALQNYRACKVSLNDVGLAIIKSKGKKFLAVHPPVVTRKLLNDLKQYEYNKIKEPLSRFEGVIKDHPARIGDKTQKCLLIPWEVISEKYDPKGAVWEEEKSNTYTQIFSVN